MYLDDELVPGFRNTMLERLEQLDYELRSLISTEHCGDYFVYTRDDIQKLGRSLEAMLCSYGQLFREKCIDD